MTRKVENPWSSSLHYLFSVVEIILYLFIFKSHHIFCFESCIFTFCIDCKKFFKKNLKILLICASAKSVNYL